MRQSVEDDVIVRERPKGWDVTVTRADGSAEGYWMDRASGAVETTWSEPPPRQGLLDKSTAQPSPDDWVEIR
jgi:hypothetical protein